MFCGTISPTLKLTASTVGRRICGRPATTYLLISKKSPNAEAILDAFNRGLAKMRVNGAYERFMDEFEAGLLARSR